MTARVALIGTGAKGGTIEELTLVPDGSFAAAKHPEMFHDTARDHTFTGRNGDMAREVNCAQDLARRPHRGMPLTATCTKILWIMMECCHGPNKEVTP